MIGRQKELGVLTALYQSESFILSVNPDMKILSFEALRKIMPSS